ncbi:MAG TPA: hypothetical protein VMB34_24515 [Acetobacteraceae bacterium]|nr:hypothetical protein [Acetobacteraceae bacterium]
MPRRVLGAVGAVLGGGGGTPLAAVAPSPDALATEAIRRLGLQSTLPTPQPPPSWWSLDLSDWLLLSIALAALVLVVYCLKDFRWGPRRGGVDPLSEPSDPSGTEQAAHLVRADHFARQGRFGEAMHEVLLQALVEMRAPAGVHLADSLTSREILRMTRLPEQGRAALRAMIAQVEWAWFGEHAARFADYRACQASFDELRAALRPSPADPRQLPADPRPAPA